MEQGTDNFSVSSSWTAAIAYLMSLLR